MFEVNRLRVEVFFGKGSGYVVLVGGGVGERCGVGGWLLRVGGGTGDGGETFDGMVLSISGYDSLLL